MSGDLKLRIPFWDSFVCCIVFTQGSCVIIQYNLPESCSEFILIKPWTQLIDYSLPGLALHVGLSTGISHLSISGIVVQCRGYISHCFYFFHNFNDCSLILCLLFLFSCLLTAEQPGTCSNLFALFLFFL